MAPRNILMLKTMERSMFKESRGKEIPTRQVLLTGIGSRNREELISTLHMVLRLCLDQTKVNFTRTALSMVLRRFMSE